MKQQPMRHLLMCDIIIVIHCQFSKIEIKKLVAFAISFGKSAERNYKIVPIGKLKYCRLNFENYADYRTEKLIIDGY